MNCAYLRYKAISAERGRDIQDEKNKALDNNRYTTKPSLSPRDHTSQVFDQNPTLDGKTYKLMFF